MLINVNVKNLALINKVDIYFDDGLNIMTGETGAGKSIIIGSILIALGGRIPKDIVRDESKEALIELAFQIHNPLIRQQLEKMGVELDDEGNLIIARRIIGGRSNIKVNGENYTTGNLKKITELLIDIHGQHDHQSLLKPSKQLEILDDFAGNEIKQLKQDISQEYKSYRELQRQLEEFDIDDDKRAREISFCRFEIEEIENAHLVEGEMADTESLYKKISSSQTIIEKMNELYSLFDDRMGGISERVSEAYRISQSASELDEDLSGIVDSIADMESICADTKRAVRDYVEEMSFDEQQAREVEQRLDLLNRLRQKYENEKKYTDPIKNILAYKSAQEKKLDLLENLESRKNELQSELHKAESALEVLSDRLTKVRKTAASELGGKIVEVLNGLNFLDAKFEIQFTKKGQYTANGCDDIEFMISTNPGEETRPLQKIASGGELSRIMLGIKTIMASKDEIETLIFDEIDTGISGRTAQMVAKRLSELSGFRQVICITHLPQIAAMANAHFLIEKKVTDNVTQTSIDKLEEEQSVNELARMLGGEKITDTVLQNAREMKQLARGIHK